VNLTGVALLDAIRYLPSVRTRTAELRGYAELRQETKDALHPLVSLGQLGNSKQPARILELALKRVGPCFLDLNTATGQTCENWEDLCDPANNFEAWRTFAASGENVTPVALLRDGATERPFVRQILAIERDFGAVVVRSRKPAQELAALQAALSAVDDVNNLLIVLDFGFIRGAFEPKETEARRVITALRTIDPGARIAVLSSSYPRNVSVYGDSRGTLEILEREMHANLGGEEVAIYGDHASIYPEPFEASVSRWVPRVDYCLSDAWRWERRRDDAGGFVECARRVVALPDWEPDFADRAWGAGIIRTTATQGFIESGFGSPANWIAARVNMHIERQAGMSAAGEADDLDDDDEF